MTSEGDSQNENEINQKNRHAITRHLADPERANTPVQSQLLGTRHDHGTPRYHRRRLHPAGSIDTIPLSNTAAQQDMQTGMVRHIPHTMDNPFYTGNRCAWFTQNL